MAFWLVISIKGILYQTSLQILCVETKISSFFSQQLLFSNLILSLVIGLESIVTLIQPNLAPGYNIYNVLGYYSYLYLRMIISI